MRLTLQITDGPELGRRIHLRQGQVAQFGRTEWADFSFPRDGTMADIHFQLECVAPCARLQRLQAAHLTWVNDQEVTEAELRHGDRIRAGSTTLTVMVDGDLTGATTTAALAGAAAVAEAADEAKPTEISPPEACDLLELNDEARAIAETQKTLAEFQDALEQQQQYTAAIRLQAYRFTPQVAVWWGTECVAALGLESLPPHERASYDAARNWALEPDEERRRVAETAASRTSFEMPGSWLAMAVFWSDNLAPPDAAPVPPDPRLTGNAVTSALMIAAYQGNPLEAFDRYQKFLELARQVAKRGVPVKRA